jgi:uncharacterized membrane protein YfcA
LTRRAGSSIVHWLQDWNKIAWREIARLMPFTLLGVLIGARLGHYLGGRIDQRRFNLGVGVLLMAIGAGLVLK